MSTPKNASRRRLLRATADAGLFAILASTFAGRALAAEKNGGAGAITLMKGQVFVNGKHASTQTTIPTNAEIRTGSRSMVAFSAGGDAHVLKSNTSITLSSSGGFTDQLRLLTGALLSAWGQRPEGRQAKLANGTATIGIRGTVTYATAGKFSLLEGSVEYGYTDRNGVNKTVTLTRDASGKAVSVDERGNVIENWVPPISKSDVTALMQAIAALSGTISADAARALNNMQDLLEELDERTESGELTMDVPPESGGEASP